MQDPQISPWEKDTATTSATPQGKDWRGKTLKFLCVREWWTWKMVHAWRWTAPLVREWTDNGGLWVGVRECSAQACGKECLHEWRECLVVIISPQREVQSTAGVWVWAWTDSPATPLPKPLTAITSLSCQQKLLIESGWLKQRKITHGFFPLLAQGLTNSPTSLSLGKSCPFHFICHDRSWLCSFY